MTIGNNMEEQTTNLQMAVVPQSFLLKLESKIDSLMSLIREKSEQEFNSQLIESLKIPAILGISRKTWQTYRDKRLIPFCQIGAIIYVKQSDLDFFIQSHTIKSK